ncbi:MAG: 2-C-methyl-D-erythritol 2,4-cyclodiphosphate synthase [Phycisphaeraceae bacterium]|nr:2-C-methyl-D-erythritol 2,4-cyclodiphosphate synthase [Phycisphaeraceae bacterium]
MTMFRIGHGYDLHRLDALPPKGGGRPLVLGGVRIEHPTGPVAHSDGDALLHAVTDALLGAIGAPDIGRLFPDSDPLHDAQDSKVFLCEAARRVREAGYALVNLDATVVLERPRIGPRVEDMRRSVATMLGISMDAINIKGKSHEGVDAVGEGRAVEVHVVALLASTMG